MDFNQDIPDLSEIPEIPEGDSSEMEIFESTDVDQVMPPLENEIFEHDELREIGNPEHLADNWRFQGETMDCALNSQGAVLEAFGQDFDLEKYKQQGMDEGWYDPEDGTLIPNIGDLIEANGVAVNKIDGASVQDLAQSLEQGKGVVVVVDTEPLWGEPGGHALQVTGMDVGDDGNPVNALCNDSGREDGQCFAYPFEDFKQAWGMMNNFMVATRDPIPGLPRGGNV